MDTNKKIKIGISSGNFHDAKPLRADRINRRQEGYRKMHATGFDCCDLGCLVPPASYLYSMPLDEAIKDAKLERKIAESEGVIINQLHGIWPTDDTTPELRREKLKFMERAIRLTPYYGTPYLVIHPDLPYGWYDEETDPEFTKQTNIEMFQALLPIAEESGTVICLENMPTLPYKMSPTPEIFKFIQEINHPNLKMCLDTGHTNIYDNDIRSIVRLIGPVLKVMHVHDNMGIQDQHLWPHEGTINWDGFALGLHDIGFEGVLSLETSAKVKSMDEEGHTESMLKLASIARKIADKATFGE